MERHFAASEDKPVYDRIKELLVTYAFFPGDRLHVPDLADQLRVSATPVREALNRFCAEGLLTAVPHRGFFVKKLDHEEISNLLEAKYMILDYAVDGSITRLQLDDGERLMISSLAGLDRGDRDTGELLKIYERYATPMTLLIGSLSENAALLKYLVNVLDKLHFVSQTELCMGDRAQAVVRESAGIAQCLLKNSEKGVKAVLRQRLQREQATLEDLMKECVNRLYLRCQPVQPRERRAQLATLSA